MQAWLWLLVTSLLSAAVAQTSTSSAVNSVNSTVTRPLGTRAHHGLKQDGMQVNSIYVGVLPDWAHQSPVDINKALGKSIAIIGDYIYVTASSSSPFSQMQYHSPDVIRLKDYSVYAPAVIPNFSLNSWTTEMSTALAEECAYFNTRGVPVWLRFAYEMNGMPCPFMRGDGLTHLEGAWMAYGIQPDIYKTKFREVAAAVQANSQCNSTYMLWSPNIAGGDLDGPQGYTQYYPGDDVVDIVGLSFYYSGEDKRQNTVPEDGEFISSFAPFYRLYGNKRPVVISETSAQYHYEIPASYDQNGIDTEVKGTPDLSVLTPIPAVGSPSELSMKSTWLQEMTSGDAAGRFPNLTSVSIFNYFKEGNLTQFNDFRYIGGKPEVESWMRSYVGNVTAYQGGFDGAASTSRPGWTIIVFLFIVSFYM